MGAGNLRSTKGIGRIWPAMSSCSSSVSSAQGRRREEHGEGTEGLSAWAELDGEGGPSVLGLSIRGSLGHHLPWSSCIANFNRAVEEHMDPTLPAVASTLSCSFSAVPLPAPWLSLAAAALVRSWIGPRAPSPATPPPLPGAAPPGSRSRLMPHVKPRRHQKHTWHVWDLG